MVVFYLYHEQVVLFGEKQTYRVSQKNGVLFTNLQQALVSAGHFLALKNSEKKYFCCYNADKLVVEVHPTVWDIVPSVQHEI